MAVNNLWQNFATNFFSQKKSPNWIANFFSLPQKDASIVLASHKRRFGVALTSFLRRTIVVVTFLSRMQPNFPPLRIREWFWSHWIYVSMGLFWAISSVTNCCEMSLQLELNENGSVHTDFSVITCCTVGRRGQMVNVPAFFSDNLSSISA